MNTELRDKSLLYFLYINKLQEFGLLQGCMLLEPKGFDIAIDCYKEGLKLNDEEIKIFIKSDQTNFNEKEQKKLFELIKELQRLGFDKAKKRVYIGKKPSLALRLSIIIVGFLIGCFVGKLILLLM